MAVDFLTQRANFSSLSGGPRTQDLTFLFPTNVNKAAAAVNGFSVGFTDSDHHLFREQVDTAVLSIAGNAVTVRVSYALRDSSGTFDDRYDGFVDVLAIVDRS
jgi:hypothetical protein